MEKMNKIYLKTRFKDARLIHLRDIIPLIKDGCQYSWAVLDFDAINYTGGAQPIANYLVTHIYQEKKIDISWEEIKILAEGVFQFVDLVLIGSKNSKKLKPYQYDEEMFQECDIVIIMFDTSWWEIGCKDPILMSKFKEKFKDELKTMSE